MYFTQFDFVFVVFLDLIDLFTSLEDAILQQYCINDTQRQRIMHVCENLGKKCLVVLDGANDNLSDIFSEMPWSKSNFPVMSGHLADENIDNKFSKVCKIQGFTRKEAESLIVKDKSRVSAILNCKTLVPATSDKYNPMLVMFLCVLDDSALDRPINNESMSLCATFLKLVLLVSKQGLEAFCKEVRSFGRMLLQRLLLGKSLVGHFSQEFTLLVNH